MAIATPPIIKSSELEKSVQQENLPVCLGCRGIIHNIPFEDKNYHGLYHNERCYFDSGWDD